MINPDGDDLLDELVDFDKEKEDLECRDWEWRAYYERARQPIPLQREWISCYGLKRPVFIPHPEEPFGRDFYSERYGMRGTDLSGSSTSTLKKLRHEKERIASIKETDKDLEFEFEVRRRKPLGEMEINKHVTHLSHEYDEWSLFAYGRDAYRDFIYPYVKDSASTNPFDWARARTEVALGFIGMQGHTQKFPFHAIQHPFTELASLATNVTPDWHAEPKRLSLTPARRALRARLETMDNTLPPEVHWLVLENETLFTEVESFEEELKALRECIRNGLLIERVDQCLKRSGNPKATLQVVMEVYQGDRPWWFKEDIDFNALWDGPETAVTSEGFVLGPDEKGFSVLRRLAHNCKAGFEYGVEAFKQGGYKLFSDPDLGTQRAWRIFDMVVNNYGIGNIERAVWIFNWFLDGLKEIRSPKEKPSFADLFEKQARRERPWYPLLGKMEGGDSGIHFPGLLGFFTTMRGEQVLIEDKLDDTNLQVGHLMLMDRMVSRPLASRALEVGKPRVPTHKYRLLPGPGANTTPQITASEPAPCTHPLLGTLKFYAQLNDAKLEHADDVVTYYWMFFANKLPDPYNPPLPLLRVIDRIVTLPVSGHEHPFMAHPSERAAVSERNAQLKVWQLQTAASMLTGLSFGHVSEAQTIQLLEDMIRIPDDHSVEGEAYDSKMEATLRFTCGEFLGLNMEMTARGWLPPACLKDLIDDWRKNDTRLRASIGGRKRAENAEYMRALFEQTSLNPERLLKLVESRGASDHIERDYYARAKVYRPMDLVEDLWQAADALRALQPVMVEVDRKARAEMHKTIREVAWAGVPEVVQALDLVASDAALGFSDWIKTYWSGFPLSIRTILDAQSLAQQVPVLQVMHRLYQEYLGDSHSMTIESLHSLVSALPAPQGSLDLAAAEKVDQRLAGLLLGVELQRENLQIRNERHDPVGKLTEQTAGIVAFVAALGSHAEHLSPRLIASGREGPKKKVSEFVYEVGMAIRTALKKTSEARVDVLDMIRQFRREDFGLVPVGGKIHVLDPVDHNQLEFLRKILALNRTSFRLIHAGSSLLIPGVPSSREAGLVVGSLGQLGLFDRTRTELQICLPGRLAVPDVALLGSTILGGSSVVVDYTVDSFKTTHDSETGARIMAYDANGPRDNYLPFMPELPGRTDMLGRRSLEDLLIAQRVGTALIHATESAESRFTPEGEWLRQEHPKILDKYGLKWTLGAPWIFVNEGDKYSNRGAKEHHRVVQAHNEAYVRGFNDDVRALLEELESKMRPKQEALLESDEALQERALLLNF